MMRNRRILWTGVAFAAAVPQASFASPQPMVEACLISTQAKAQFLAVYCAGTPRALLRDRIVIYDAKRTNDEVTTSFPLEKEAVAGIFLNRGQEAVVVYRDATIQYLWFTETDGVHKWDSKMPPTPKRIGQALLANNGDATWVVLPDAMRFAVFYRGSGGIEAIEGGLPNIEFASAGKLSLQANDSECLIVGERHGAMMRLSR